MKRSFSLDSQSSTRSSKKLKKSKTLESEGQDDLVLTSSVSLESRKSTERTPYARDDVLPRDLSTLNDKVTLKIVSWNVNGLRAVTSKNLDVLERLVAKHQPDILCFQETKLQQENISEFENLLPAYSSVWSCSTVKKGYSGTAVFFRKGIISVTNSYKEVSQDIPKPVASKKKQQSLTSFLKSTDKSSESCGIVKEEKESEPTGPPILTVRNVYRDFENWNKAHEGEGRTITVEFDEFYLIACYVPNSGEGLVRLDYRLNEWDTHLKKYVSFLQAKKPVILTGDLNVGHLDLDIHNPEAKHIVKQAGLTPQERASFTNFLSETGCLDAFRYLYPESKGQFTYWSQRAFARPVNRGIRLDYFICSPNLFPLPSSEEIQRTAVFDSYILHEDTIGCSDHCPVVLVLTVDK